MKIEQCLVIRLFIDNSQCLHTGAQGLGAIHEGLVHVPAQHHIGGGLLQYLAIRAEQGGPFQPLVRMGWLAGDRGPHRGEIRDGLGCHDRGH